MAASYLAVSGLLFGLAKTASIEPLMETEEEEHGYGLPVPAE